MWVNDLIMVIMFIVLAVLVVSVLLVNSRMGSRKVEPTEPEEPEEPQTVKSPVLIHTGPDAPAPTPEPATTAPVEQPPAEPTTKAANARTSRQPNLKYTELPPVWKSISRGMPD